MIERRFGVYERSVSVRLAVRKTGQAPGHRNDFSVLIVIRGGT